MEAIIFDMDGVLIDSEYSYFEAKDGVLAAAGKSVPSSYHGKFMGTSYLYTWETMKQELDLPKPAEAYVAEMIQRRQEIIDRDGIRPIKGAIELVQRLAEEQQVLAVASSSPLTEIERSLRNIGIYDHFKVITSGEEVTHSKPAPDVYLLAAKRLGVDPAACVALEDSPNGSQAVKNANMMCVGFANPDYPKLTLASDWVVDSYDFLTATTLTEKFSEYQAKN